MRHRRLEWSRNPTGHRQGRDPSSLVTAGRVAVCEARLRSAHAFVLSELNDLWTSVQATGKLTIEDRMRIRLCTTHASHEAKWVPDTIYDNAGAAAIFANAPYERRFRDIHTVTQQMQGRKDHLQNVGAFLLGHPAVLASL